MAVGFAAAGLLVASCSGGGGAPHDPPASANATPGRAADGDGSHAMPAAGPPWLVDATAELGIDFVHHAGLSGRFETPEILGAGVAVFDADGDGDLDLYFLNGNDRFVESAGRPARTPAPTNRFYRQEAGGRFSDRTEDSGLGDPGYGMGVAVGDVDNDGDLDLYVANNGPDRLFLNRGDGTFEDATTASGIDVPGFSTSVAFLDQDGDGWLDVFVLQYVDYRFEPCTNALGRPDYCGPLSFEPVPDLFLRGLGGGRFADASEAAGLGVAAPAPGLGVVVEDFDSDGRPDVYVANDGHPNHLWINAGGGTFEERAMRMGAAYNSSGQAEAGMGLIAEDLDGDLGPDLFMTHLRVETNTFYRNLGRARGFRDATAGAGLGVTSMNYTGFGVAALDLELDGDLDLAIANGRVYRLAPEGRSDCPPPLDELAEQNLLYLNDGSGNFVQASSEQAADFVARVEVSRGVVAADLDGDGDLDLVLTNGGGPARIHRNEAPRRGHWLSVRALDPALGRDAIGGSVTVVAGERRMRRTVRTSSGYLTAYEPVVHFGLGTSENVQSIEVRWPGGPVERFPGVEADRAVTLRRGTGVELDG